MFLWPWTLNGGLLNLKQDMDATRDNVKTMCHCSCIYRDFFFFPLMHSELTCTGTFNADVVKESLFATIIRVSFLSNPNVNDNSEEERKGRLYNSSSRSHFSN